MTSTHSIRTRARVGQRLVVIARGAKSQTASVCTERNDVGTYETKYRLPATVALTAEVLEELADLEALRAWSKPTRATPNQSERALASVPSRWRPHRIRATSGSRAPASRRSGCCAPSSRSSCSTPYLHRVEQSLHAWLFSLLIQQPELSAGVTLSTGEQTQLVHKEWPETIPGVEGDDQGPRGLFDLAVLSPRQLASATLDQFRAGRVEAPIVIEVGLGYGLSHLQRDRDKLLHSRVHMPYVLHLSRLAMRDQDETESLLCHLSEPVRAAYVHHDPRNNARRYKHVADGTVTDS